jgi:predicted Fe-Mo cluster-binding NifX family protein
MRIKTMCIKSLQDLSVPLHEWQPSCCLNRREERKMKTAFAVWENRIAPVFDVARRVCIVETGNDPVPLKEIFELPGGHPAGKAGFLADLQVETLVCGAVTGPARWFLASRGIQVIAFVAGDLEKVIGAWLEGRLPLDETFLMPGCCGFRRRGKTQGSPGACRGGAGGRRPGGPGPGAGRRSGACVCPACGHLESQIPGMPCGQRECPACGAPMRKYMEGRL